MQERVLHSTGASPCSCQRGATLFQKNVLGFTEAQLHKVPGMEPCEVITFLQIFADVVLLQ